jgi:hypothetical protein
MTKKYLETTPGKYSIDSLQETAVLGTSHIIRTVLQSENWSLSNGVHHCFKRKCDKKILWKEKKNNNNNKRQLGNTKPKKFSW